VRVAAGRAEVSFSRGGSGGAGPFLARCRVRYSCQERPMSEDRVMTPTEQESRRVAEEAREAEWNAPSFVRELFLGNFRLDLIHPYPQQTPEDAARTDAYLAKVERFLREEVDPEEIDRTGEIPESVLQGL